MNWTSVDSVVARHLDKTFPAAQLEILHRGASVYSRAFGILDPDARSRMTSLQTQFDLASVSKLFTATAFMTLVEQSRVTLDQPVCEILPEFSGERPIAPYPDPLKPGAFVEITPDRDQRVDASCVTFRHLLAHNSGLPAWLPLWKMESLEARRRAVFTTAFAYPTAARSVYSDIGLILVGWAMERIESQSLDRIIRERVAAPLKLESVSYGPLAEDNVAPTEFYAHRGRRMWGEVHDENAAALDGIAGHAGLFGTARDVAQLGSMYLHAGAPLLKPETVSEMTRLQAEDGSIRRGIGFALWSPDPEASGNPFSEKAYGHSGFTGTSLWVDPTRELVVAAMTNRVYYGRTNADDILTFRVALHRAIAQTIDN